MIPAKRKPNSQSAGPFHQLRSSPSQVVTASLHDAGGSGLDNRCRACYSATILSGAAMRIKTSSAPAARRVGSSNGKRFERLPFSILEPSRPALCETISAVDRPRGVRFKRNLRGLATVRAHRIKHLTRAAVVAASASSAASVFVHSLPTVRPLLGRTTRRESPRLLKVCTTAPYRGLTGRGAQRSKLMRNAGCVDRGGHRFRSSVLRHVNLKQG